VLNEIDLDKAIHSKLTIPAYEEQTQQIWQPDDRPCAQEFEVQSTLK